MKIGIIGMGRVGTTTNDLFKSNGDTILLCYDWVPQKCDPLNINITDLNTCDLIFICVPTPMTFNGHCHLEIINDYVKQFRQLNFKGDIVIRSTVQPGTCQRLGCHNMPSFTTDINNYTESGWIIGFNQHINNTNNFKHMIQGLLTSAKKNGTSQSDIIQFVTINESEIIKYTRNAFLATKISFFNEIEQFCRCQNVSFENIRKHVCVDKRIGDSHSYVPGTDGIRGFGGKALMKDLSAFSLAMEQGGSNPTISRAVLGRNARHDRPAEKWIKPSIPELPDRSILVNLKITTLQRMCKQHGIDISDCVEKTHLVDRILENKIPNQIPRHTGSNIDQSRQLYQPSNANNIFQESVNSRQPVLNITQLNNQNLPSIGFTGGIQSPF